MSRTARLLAALAVASGVVGCIGMAQAGQARDADSQRSLANVRRATAQYHDVKKALADGYVATDVCVPEMGFHYVHPGRLADPAIDPTQPEVLIYEEGSHGAPRLVAVEWFAVDPDQDVTTDDGRPSLFGVGFDGPMLGHEPGMPVHFDLHAWVWKHNPAGTLTADNPRVVCS